MNEMEKTLRQLTETLIDKDHILKENAAMFKAMFCINPAAMVLVEVKSGLIVEVNQAFTEMCGYTYDEAVGKTVFDLSLYSNPEDRTVVVDTILKQGFIKNEPITYRLKDGSLLPCLLSSKTIYKDGKELILSVVVDDSACVKFLSLAKEFGKHRRIGD